MIGVAQEGELASKYISKYHAQPLDPARQVGRMECEPITPGRSRCRTAPAGIKKMPTKVPPTTTIHDQEPDTSACMKNEVGLSVKIEVNLPANGTPDVYDAIFASVRKRLIDRD